MGNDSIEGMYMIFFRADSNLTIASGHIMRCIAIATKFIEKGHPVQFLISDDNAVDMLEHYGMPYYILNTNWQDLLDGVEETVDLMQQYKDSVLFIDSYQVTKEYVSRVKHAGIVGYLGSKKEYLGHIDFIINYSLDIDYDFYAKNYGKKTRLLLGTQYAPLRQEFSNSKFRQKQEVRSIMLTSGNSSYNGITEKILSALYAEIDESIEIDVVVGAMFSDKESLRKKYAGVKNIHLYENVKSMAEIMKKVDLAISANGTTVYELSAIGVPVVSFAMVEEQLKSSKAMARAKAVAYCGASYENEKMCIKEIINQVHFLSTSNEMRNEMIKRAHDLIDGQGCNRIRETIENMIGEK